MARSRGRGTATDRDRFPDFEGIGPGFAGDPNYPGANRGDVGVGAFEQPSVQGPQRRIAGLRASNANAAREAARAQGAVARGPRVAAPSPSAPGATGRPVQGGTGALPPGGPRRTGRQRSRRG